VIPERFVDHGIACRSADTLLVTATMAEPKSRMESLANAYIALAGGYGTLEELAEVITLKQAHYLDEAIVAVNTDGFYRHLLAHLEHLIAAGFASDGYRDLYAVVETPAEAVAYIEAWVPRAYPEKWEPPAP